MHGFAGPVNSAKFALIMNNTKKDIKSLIISISKRKDTDMI